MLIYHLNPEHEEVLREYLKENLEKGNIRLSISLVGYPILFVLKKIDKDGKKK